MKLSDISVKRPVFACVINMLLVLFGVICLSKLPLRELPDIQSPVVSINTSYSGASSNIIETKITKVIEDSISGISGIKTISSSSLEGHSKVTIVFKRNLNIDIAANDIRNRVSRILGKLPKGVDIPEISKVDPNTQEIIWLTVTSDRMNANELTDYVNRYALDRFSLIDGVASAHLGGGRRYAMRVWIDSASLAAHDLTVIDIEKALLRENVELPAGHIKSKNHEFTVRVNRVYKSKRDFESLIIKKGKNYNHLVRLGEVAKVELGSEEYNSEIRFNGDFMVGIGITKQSNANTLEVARKVNAELKKITNTLPLGIKILKSYDSSVFIESSIHEVYKTFAISTILVVIIIYIFLGSYRAMFIPAITVPVSIIATFIFLYIADFSINLITLLAMILSIGLVVDDSIVVLENISRRIEEGESPLVAAFKGSRQVAFAVIATTLVLIFVFLPVVFLEGKIGSLFVEFVLTIVAAVSFSAFVALSLSAMLCSRWLVKEKVENRFVKTVENFMYSCESYYKKSLLSILKHKWIVFLSIIFSFISILMLLSFIPREFGTKEDRGAFFVFVTGPEGVNLDYMSKYMQLLEKDLQYLYKTGDANSIFSITGGSSSEVNRGIIIVTLKDWSKRRSAWKIMDELRGKLAAYPGIFAFPVMKQSIGGSNSRPVQFVIGGSDYKELSKWKNIILANIKKGSKSGAKLLSLETDYKETKPQMSISIDKSRAAYLGISLQNISHTLETILSSRKVTSYVSGGEEYDIIIKGLENKYNTPKDLSDIYVRSEINNKIISISNVLNIDESIVSSSLNRYNRVRAITIEGGVAHNYSLGEALLFLENIVKENLPEKVIVDYKGNSLEYKNSNKSMLFLFFVSVMVVFLVLAAQFEHFIHPISIMITVPFAILGALIGLYLTGLTLNIYSEIGIIMLVGLAAKNGILIVEFINQFRELGISFNNAIVEASVKRLRPILMTTITTIVGAVPLIVSFGAGSETRVVIGVVVFSGVLFSTLITLYAVPVCYSVFSKNTSCSRITEEQLLGSNKGNKGN